ARSSERTQSVPFARHHYRDNSCRPAVFIGKAEPVAGAGQFRAISFQQQRRAHDHAAHRFGFTVSVTVAVALARTRALAVLSGPALRTKLGILAAVIWPEPRVATFSAWQQVELSSDIKSRGWL